MGASPSSGLFEPGSIFFSFFFLNRLVLDINQIHSHLFLAWDILLQMRI